MNWNEGLLRSGFPGRGGWRGELEISAIKATSPDTPAASMKAGGTPRQRDRRRGPECTGVWLRGGGALSTRPRSGWWRVRSEIRLRNTVPCHSAGSCGHHATAQSDRQGFWTRAAQVPPRAAPSSAVTLSYINSRDLGSPQRKHGWCLRQRAVFTKVSHACQMCSPVPASMAPWLSIHP